MAETLVPRMAKAAGLPWPIGIQLYMVGKALTADPAGTLKQLHAWGYREVETAGFGKLSAKEFRKLLDDSGLKCPSAHLQFAPEQIEAQFEAAKVLGAHYAVSSVLHGAEPKAGGLGVEGFKKAAALMNEAGKKAKAAGLQYAYHNHNFEFEKMPDGAPGYDIILKETDPELVKFEVDCGWMSVAGHNPVDYFKKYPGRIKMLHIKDFKPVSTPSLSLSGDQRPQGRDLGTGFVDYRPIFAAGKAAGVEHIFAEQEEPFKVSQMESAKADIDYLHKISS